MTDPGFTSPGPDGANPRSFKAGTFGSAWEVFADYEEQMRQLGVDAGTEISNLITEDDREREWDELRSIVKNLLPRRMQPYVDLAQETGMAFYEEYRDAALRGATVPIPENQAPGTMNIIDQDGNFIESRIVGQASADDVFNYTATGLGKSSEIVPASSWESAAGKAFKGAEERAAQEGKYQAIDNVLNKLIGYSDRRVHNVYRQTVEQNVIGDGYAVGWQRIAYAGCCAFCRMLAGRGAVYKNQASASFVVGRGVVRKVRGRPHQRGRKLRKWERPDNREIREMGSTFHDHCKCKVIPRYTFNGAEMPLPPLMQFMQDKYQAEYYTAREVVMGQRAAKSRSQGFHIDLDKVPKSWDEATRKLKRGGKRKLEKVVFGYGRKPTVYDVLGVTKWERKRKVGRKAGLRKVSQTKAPSTRDILREMRKNNLSVRQRRFMPTQPHDYMVDSLASAWKGSPYVKPRPMRFEDFMSDYATQAWKGLKEEGGILARRKGNQFVGRVTNKYATRTQRKINRKIDQIEGLPTWGNVGLKLVVAEGRRKSTRVILYNSKQGLKFLTGQPPSWNFEGLLAREVAESQRFHMGQLRRRANRAINEVESEIRGTIRKPVHEFFTPAYVVLDRGGKKFWGIGYLFTNPIKRSMKGYERKIIRRANRPFKRTATRIKYSYSREAMNRRN